MLCQLLKSTKRPLSESLVKIKKELKATTKKNEKKVYLSQADQDLITHIKSLTRTLNTNNVTRTRAYLEFYNRHPEIHWAFLGHMVSRNGGWNMTDLKGGILSRLLTKKEGVSFFSFLERGNWLIFQDAYPQFLVYEESLKRGRSLFYLLPYLHVSSFMETLWNKFWEDRDTYLLTIALIVNEQSYLELRVIENPVFKKEVFSTLEFKLQDFLSMNHILFPYEDNGKLMVIGQTLHHFTSLDERILLGKRLYALLFQDHNRLRMSEKWANRIPHTGSRKDFWPHLFNDVDASTPGKILTPRIRSCQLLPGFSRIYSPKLEFAWKNKDHDSAEVEDWFKDWQVIEYFIDSGETVDGEVKDEYCKTLERLELAAFTKKAIPFLD